MRIGLFIPCYINQFYPQVAIATLQLLEKLKLDITYPLEQTCCGQPIANTGFEKDAFQSYEHFVTTFVDFDYIVSPSGSCTHHVKYHFNLIEQTEAVKHVRANAFELTQFLIKILKKDNFGAEFPYKVGLHQSCHGLRGLRAGKSSEILEEISSVSKQLLGNVKGLELIEPTRLDECCGFGGTFSVSEEAVSVKMGNDRIQDFLCKGVEIITATDMSCLMHLEGLIRRQKLPVKVKHIAQILNSRGEDD